MNILQKTFAAASLALVTTAAAVGPALSGESLLRTSTMRPVSIEGAEGQHFNIYNFEEMVSSDFATKRHRVLVNRALGLTCEWVEEGRRAADGAAVFHTVDIKARAVGCVASVEIPSQWQSVKAKPRVSIEDLVPIFQRHGVPSDLSRERAIQYIEQYDKMTGEVSKGRENDGQLREIIMESHPHGLDYTYITHEWDLRADKVCLKTLEAPPEEWPRDTDPLDLGCYDIHNKEYLGNVLMKAGMSPS